MAGSEETPHSDAAETPQWAPPLEPLPQPPQPTVDDEPETPPYVGMVVPAGAGLESTHQWLSHHHFCAVCGRCRMFKGWGPDDTVSYFLCVHCGEVEYLVYPSDSDSSCESSVSEGMGCGVGDEEDESEDGL
eukprot:2172436-Alexandrium_andersonii.AAC.1